MLSTVGLVTARPGSGYLVMPITLKDVRSLFRTGADSRGCGSPGPCGSGVTSHSVMHLTELVKGHRRRGPTLDRRVRRPTALVDRVDGRGRIPLRDFHRLQAEIVGSSGSAWATTRGSA